jgi:hypothetical protein
MKYDLFIRVALTEDLPERNLRRGDVATVVEHHLGRAEQEPGYTLEVFNALGETIAVTAVPETALEPLRQDKVLCARVLVPA